MTRHSCLPAPHYLSSCSHLFAVDEPVDVDGGPGVRRGAVDGHVVARPVDVLVTPDLRLPIRKSCRQGRDVRAGFIGRYVTMLPEMDRESPKTVLCGIPTD